MVNDREQLVIHPDNPLLSTKGPRSPTSWERTIYTTESGVRILTDPLLGKDKRFFVTSSGISIDGEDIGWEVSVLQDEEATTRLFSVLSRW